MKFPLVLLPLFVVGCASYQPITLPTDDALVRDVRRLKVDTATMPDAGLRTHAFEPADGLDMTEVAMLAVVNNPDLRVLRAQAGITRAQAFSAGLLPDPQLALTTEQVLGSPAGATIAYSAGLTFDVGALLARSSIKGAAASESRKADLDLLWQEWQTVAKARQLFVKIDAVERSLDVLARQQARLRDRLDLARRAVERGLLTNEAATPLLTAFDDAHAKSADFERQRNQARHDLAALLGVAPEVELALTGRPDAATMDEAAVRDALAIAAKRRPDLLALQAGLEAQDDRYRGAIQAQFPAITVGPTRSRDTSNVNSAGLSLGIVLPLFNRNRGNIAIESATRAKLLAEYQQRLDATAGDAHRLLAEQALLRRQSADIAASLPALEEAANRTGAAYLAGNVDAFALTSVEGALTTRRLEQIAVDQALQEQAIALQALVGTPNHST